MSAKILAFDPNRKIPPRHYTPIAMRGRLLYMPSRAHETTSDDVSRVGLSWKAASMQVRGVSH
jgi:hypothetical protein